MRITKRIAVASLLGLVNALAFAPFDLFALAYLSLALLFILLCCTQSFKHGFLIGLAYGFTLLLFVSYWLLHSTIVYGALSPMGNLFVSLLSILLGLAVSVHFALAAGIFVFINVICVQKGMRWVTPFVFACLFTLHEWVQTIHPLASLLSYQGYTQWYLFSGFYPVLGVFGVSFLIYFLSAYTAYIIKPACCLRYKLVWLSCLIVCLTGAWFLRFVEWTERASSSLSVAMLQPNSSLREHWTAEYAIQSFIDLANTTRMHSNFDVIIWPENAVGVLWTQASYHLKKLLLELQHETTTGLFIGMFREANTDYRMGYHNSLFALGPTKGASSSVDSVDEVANQVSWQVYDKQNLVPFGEYIPFTSLFMLIIEAFNIPYSSVLSNQTTKDNVFNYAGVDWIPFICYDLDFPAFMRSKLQASKRANVLLSVSDETWFGPFTAQKLRLRMHQIRAREFGRWLIRSTGSGISAVIDPTGVVVSSLPVFQSGVLTAEVYAMKGKTPYQRFGNWLPMLISIMGCVLLLYLWKRRRA